jgi:hypothetical protein
MPCMTQAEALVICYASGCRQHVQPYVLGHILPQQDLLTGVSVTLQPCGSHLKSGLRMMWYPFQGF